MVQKPVGKPAANNTTNKTVKRKSNNASKPAIKKTKTKQPAKKKSNDTFQTECMKNKSPPESLTGCSLTPKDIIQIIGGHLKEEIGHQKQYLIAGLYPSSIAANEVDKTLSLKYNDIDVYVKCNNYIITFIPNLIFIHLKDTILKLLVRL